MLVVVREILEFLLDLLVVLFGEFEWSFLEVVFSISVVDEGTECSTLGDLEAVLLPENISQHFYYQIKMLGFWGFGVLGFW